MHSFIQQRLTESTPGRRQGRYIKWQRTRTGVGRALAGGGGGEASQPVRQEVTEASTPGGGDKRPGSRGSWRQGADQGENDPSPGAGKSVARPRWGQTKSLVKRRILSEADEKLLKSLRWERDIVTRCVYLLPWGGGAGEWQKQGAR